MNIRRHLLPEEEELQVKQAELTILEEELASKELELETLRSEISAFLRVYFASVGPLVLERDRLLASIARAIFALNATDVNRTRSREADEVAGNAEKNEVGQPGPGDQSLPPRFEPSEELRELYIQLVKQAHPDLATDEEDRLKRNEFMARANLAYRDGDEEALRAMAEEWSNGINVASDESIGDQLVRLIRQIAAVKGRLIDAGSDISGLKRSEEYLLMDRCHAESEEGEDPISRWFSVVEEEIEILQRTVKSSLALLDPEGNPLRECNDGQ